MLKFLRTAIEQTRLGTHDDSGLSLVEMMVASAVSLIILTLMTTMLTVFAKADTSTVNNANAAANVRVALLQLQHDVQSANPLSTLSSVAAYNDELQLTIQPSNQVITWQYTYSNTSCPGTTSTWCGTLTRTIGSGTPVVELTAVTNGNASSGGLPVFSYYDHCAINQVNEPQATPASVSGATTVVQITLAVANLNSAPYGTTTRVNIMNQPPGASRCG
jgi:prepilin-type N-terminal cleavage/methylation domain-containing protein